MRILHDRLGRSERAAAESLGCLAVFDNADPKLAQLIRTATSGRGIDVILDTSAGAHLSDDLAALATGGRIGFLASFRPPGARNYRYPCGP
jgi:NADPH:quinone reductase-like Zn-dependent oxidoreductase